MTWKELINDEIQKLSNERDRESKRLKKLSESESPVQFAKKVEILANVKSIDETINELYLILGRSSKEIESEE